MHCVYHKQWANQKQSGYPWKARCGSATGTFKTIADIKKWAKKLAKAQGKSVTFEKIA